MKLRTALFISACFILLSPFTAIGSPLPKGYYALVFDKDKADLSPGIQKFIDLVVQVRAHQTYQFDVTDHAKDLGISNHDRALSNRRAKAAVTRLIVDGLPKSMIEICYTSNFGSDYSAIQGPCEPHNRQLVVLMPYTPPTLPPGVIEVP